MKQLLKNGLFIVLGLPLWQAASLMVSNPIILPGPGRTLQEMMELIRNPEFQTGIALTIGRGIGSLLLSLAAGIGLAMLCRRKNAFSICIDQAVLFLRSIPNVSFIIILLFWLPRNTAVLVIAFLLVFPIVYTSFLEELRQLDCRWKPLFHIYPQPFYRRMSYVYIPLLRPLLYASLQSASALCFKAVVMAEVLCQVSAGLGQSLQQERFMINMAGVFACTLWLLLIVFFLNQLNRFLFGRLLRKG